MKTDRRTFIRNSGLIAGFTAVSPSITYNRTNHSDPCYPDYSYLDKVLKLPVLKRELLPEPVIIESVELHRDRDNFI
ncbi:MAG: hypothetical protein R3250_09230 [Melioribacteraceae bacterium]|nr:hypothetical protein [Melioribacteraceae bacterium]